MIMMMIMILMMWDMKISTMMNWPLSGVNNGHQMQKIALFGTAHILRKALLLKSHPCLQIFGECPVQGEFVAALVNCTCLQLS